MNSQSGSSSCSNQRLFAGQLLWQLSVDFPVFAPISLVNSSLHRVQSDGVPERASHALIGTEDSNMVIIDLASSAENQMYQPPFGSRSMSCGVGVSFPGTG